MRRSRLEIRSLENEIPANWKSVNKDYKKITLALKKERQAIAVLLTRPMVTSLMRCWKVPMRWPGCARCCRHCLDKIRMDRHDAEAEAALIEATAAVAEIAGGEAIAAELDKAAKGFSSRRFKPEDGEGGS